MNKKIILSIVAIIIIGTIVFLSQQAYTRGIGKNLISGATDQVSKYLTKGSNWALSSIYPKISEEVEKRGDVIKNEFEKGKQNVTESIGKKIENYISGVANSLAGKNNTCTTTAP